MLEDGADAKDGDKYRRHEGRNPAARKILHESLFVSVVRKDDSSDPPQEVRQCMQDEHQAVQIQQNDTGHNPALLNAQPAGIRSAYR